MLVSAAARLGGGHIIEHRAPHVNGAEFIRARH